MSEVDEDDLDDALDAVDKLAGMDQAKDFGPRDHEREFSIARMRDDLPDRLAHWLPTLRES